MPANPPLEVFRTQVVAMAWSQRELGHFGVTFPRPLGEDLETATGGSVRRGVNAKVLCTAPPWMWLAAVANWSVMPSLNRPQKALGLHDTS